MSRLQNIKDHVANKPDILFGLDDVQFLLAFIEILEDQVADLERAQVPEHQSSPFGIREESGFALLVNAHMLKQGKRGITAATMAHELELGMAQVYTQLLKLYHDDKVLNRKSTKHGFKYTVKKKYLP